MRLLAVCAAGLAALAFAQCVAAGSEPRSELDARLQRRLEEIRSAGQLPGMTAAVLQSGAPLRRFAAGYADLEDHTPMRPGAVMPAGSVGKQFVAMVAVALEQRGRIDLDARIDRWFAHDPWFDRVPNAHALTLRMLLMHRGGLPDHRDSRDFHAAVAERLSHQPYDPQFRIAPEVLVSFILDAPALFPPGEGFRYSETGYILAGMALERACGCRYYDELKHDFLEPLGLAHTWPATVLQVPGLVQGYIGSKIPEFPARTLEHGRMRFSPATEWTGGGLFSNTDDLARWSVALYEERALPRAYLKELLGGEKQPPAGKEGYGLGVRILPTDLGVAYGHGGEFPGYLSYTLYFPRYRTAVAVQTNTAASSADFLKEATISLMHVLADQGPR
jgi:D-alanyl-D-alanine carboxypeptidase